MQLSEGDWLDGARRLDENTLADIYDAFSAGLYRYAFRLIGDGQTAEDIVSEVFQRFLIALRSGAGPRQHLRAYLYRATHNLAVDHHRRHRPELELDGMMPDAGENPEVSSERAAAAQRARAALWLLTPEQRQVILLKFFEGLDNEEVAAAVEKPVGAVKSLQHRGLQALRRILETDTASDLERDP